MRLLHHITRTLGLAATLLCGGLLSSCDGFIYDAEEECGVTYRLHFRYDMNLKWADAFANEVKSVRVYAYDDAGTLVKVFSDRGSHLAADGYALTLDLPAGDYRLVGWCGTDNDAYLDNRSESFTLLHNDLPGDSRAPGPDALDSAIGSTRSGLNCSLNRKSDAFHPAYSDEHLYSLFHGEIELTLPDTDNGETYDFTMPLIKDTNHVRVILHHLSGEDVNADDYVFHIEDANGLLDASNNLLPDETIRYRTWSTRNGSVALGKDDLMPDSRGVVTAVGSIADMTVGRMMEERRKDMRLTITTKEGRLVASVPVIDYALLAKDYYEAAYGRRMTDQEFLDREDDYVLTFFLDEKDNWSQTTIYIHSWRIVLHDYDLGQ